MLAVITDATGRTFSEAERNSIAKGPDEQDLVNSGLEETMIGAFHELLKTQRQTKGIPDLRIAAFVGAINKVARSYVEMGIFP
jgi:glutamate dehydrogenase (NAD(P)+)